MRWNHLPNGQQSNMTIPEDIKRLMVARIDELAANPRRYLQTMAGDSFEDRRALRFLENLHAVEDTNGRGAYTLTVWGSQVRFRLAHSHLAWIRDNWFPMGVLMVSALVGVGTIVSNVVK